MREKCCCKILCTPLSLLIIVISLATAISFLVVISSESYGKTFAKQPPSTSRSPLPRILIILESMAELSRFLAKLSVNFRAASAPTRLMLPPPQPNCGGGSSSISQYQRNNNQQHASSRIINGLDSLPFNNWPWMASLKYIQPPNSSPSPNPSSYSSSSSSRSSGSSVLEHFCAGSLIYENYVLTAAHCVDKLSKESFVVALGLNDLNDKSEQTAQNLFKVERIFLAGGDQTTDESPMLNDIALLKLDRRAVLSRHVGTICLPDSPAQADTIYGTNVIVAGWGGGVRTSGEHPSSPSSSSSFTRPVVRRRLLQQTILRVINGDSICSKYCSVFNATRLYCSYDQMYGGETNVCIGDSGGPMFTYRDGRYFLYGVVSFVITLIDPENNVRCFTQAPSYFSKVALFLEWIAARMHENGDLFYF